jgi:hypothetical protein
MKQQIHAHPRAIAMLMAAVALPFTPAFAQEAATAPPVVETVAPPAPAPEQVAPPVAATPAPVFAPSSPVVQAVPVRPAPAAEAVAAAPTVKARPAAVRPVTRSAVRIEMAPSAALPVSAARPVAVPTIAAVEPPVAAEPTPPTVSEPVQEPTAVIEPEVVDNTPWGMILTGVVALGAIILGLMFVRRRRPVVTDRTEPYVAPSMPVSEPIASLMPKPVMREPVQPIAPKPREPVMAATGERPWIGLSLAPICAGTTEAGTMVQYELIIDNASDIEAHDVRVSSFLIDGTRSSAAEQALIEPLGETQSSTVDIAANGSVPIITTIHVDRKDLNGNSFEPKIVAEARYPLPGGGEGHFAARFAIGITDGDAIKAVGLREGEGIHDDVGAELDDVLERV